MKRFLFLALCLALPTAASAATYHFDFGTANSPLAPGYTRVSLVTYSQSRGYGWASIKGMKAVDRGTADPLTRDLHNGKDNTFSVTVANGIYDVTVTLGDAAQALDGISLWAEGQLVASGLATPAGVFIRRSFRVPVADGRLDLRFADMGGSTAKYAVNGLDLVLVSTLTANAGPDRTAAEGLNVTFAGSATGGTAPLKYAWTFGDGTSAAGTLTPSHAYADNGSYTAMLTVTDAVNAVSYDTAIVTVSNVPPTAKPGGPYTGQPGSPIAFSGSATDPGTADMAAGFTYAWKFGDRGKASGATVSHSYSSAGTYTVTLTVTDKDGGKGTATTSVQVNLPSLAANAGPDRSGSEGSSVSFSGSASGGTPPYTYSWTFGDGGTASGSLTPSHTYADNGLYTATLTVKDSKNVTAQDTATATIANVAPTANAGGPYSGLAGSSIALSGSATDPSTADTTAGFIYSWAFGDGGTASGASVSHSYAATGAYTATLTVTDKDGGHSSADAAVQVNPPPLAANAGPDRSGSEGSPVSFSGSASGGTPPYTYSWTFGDGGTASGSLTPSHTYADNGLYTATLTVKDSKNVTAQDTATATIANVAPTANAGGPYSGLAGSSIALSGSATDPSSVDTSAGFTYSWAFGDGGTASGASVSHSYAATGAYTATLTVTDKDGGHSSADAAVQVNSTVLSGWYAAPNGQSNNTGSVSSPWDLKTALAGASGKIKPGDTLWLRGGSYLYTATNLPVFTNPSLFTSSLAGTPEAPILVRGYPGERAILDGSITQFPTNKNYVVLRVNGSNTWYMDFELANSDPNGRIFTFPDPGGDESNRKDRRGNSVDVYAPGTKLINLVIHDTGQGIGAWSQANDSEYYGNVVFNNGWDSTSFGSRFHGHGTYTQNRIGTKLFENNFFFNSFGNAISMYGSDQAFLNNFTWLGNVLFNGRLLFGGGTPVSNLTLRANCIYNTSVELGYSNPYNSGALLEDNYVMAGSNTVAINMKWFTNTQLFHNTAWGFRQIGITFGTGYALSDYTFDSNSYYRASADVLEFSISYPGIGGYLYKFNSSFPSPGGYGTWQGDLGYDPHGSYSNNVSRRPSGIWAMVEPNRYDADKATIVIYNWDRADTVPVDVSELGWTAGTTYELINVQDYFNDVVTGTCDSSGTIPVPMTGHTVAIPLGYTNALGPNTFPEFGAFVIVRTGP